MLIRIVKNNPPNFTMVPIELLADQDLTTADKIVWLYLKHRQGKNAHAWPSEETISRGTGGISTRTITRSTKRLQKSKWLTVTRPKPQGRGKPNKYTVTTLKKVDTVSAFIPKGRQNVRSKVDKMSDELELYNYNHSFDVFWKSYPRKVGKAEARKAWLKFKPSEQLLKKILAAIEQQKKTNQWQRENGRYIPHPTTWLNQERWDDEIETPTTEPLKRDASGRTPRELALAQIGSERA